MRERTLLAAKGRGNVMRRLRCPRCRTTGRIGAFKPAPLSMPTWRTTAIKRSCPRCRHLSATGQFLRKPPESLGDTLHTLAVSIRARGVV